MFGTGYRLEVIARTPEELAGAVRGRGAGTTVCVTDLNRAAHVGAEACGHRIAEEVLLPLVREVPGLRLVVEAGTGTGTAEAEVFAAAPGEAVLDLDAARWTEPEAFARWYARVGGAASEFESVQVYPNPGTAQLVEWFDNPHYKPSTPPPDPAAAGSTAAGGWPPSRP